MIIKTWNENTNRGLVHLADGQPWIEKDGNQVIVSFTGADGLQAQVKFTNDEWPVIKARIDAAFADEDPNQSSFYDQSKVYGQA